MSGIMIEDAAKDTELNWIRTPSPVSDNKVYFKGRKWIQ